MAGSDWERNAVGKFTVLRKLKGVHPPGRVYTAHHAATGQPALLVAVKPGERPPQPGWRMSVETGAHPSPWCAVQVLRSPSSPHPAQELAEVADLAAAALESVESLPEVQRHLEGRRNPVRRLWRTHARMPRTPFLGALGGAVAAGVLALAALRTGQPRVEARAVGAPSAVAVAEEAALVAPEAMAAGSVPSRAPLLALDMPRKPFPGQYRTEKDGTCKGSLETPIYGGCWVAVDRKPPCGNESYEHKGKCYLPGMPSAKDPSSRAPGLPTPPAHRAK